MTIERPTRSGLYGTIDTKCLECKGIFAANTPEANDSGVLWSVCTTCQLSKLGTRQATKLALRAIEGRQLELDFEEENA